MNLENIMAVSGLPGLHKLITTRSNGLIVEDLDTGKRRFITLRKHQFTPLESIGIYTYTDVDNLTDVFQRIREYEGDLPDTGSPGDILHNFFREIVPEFDEDRVHLSDMKKVLKWYGFLNERNLLDTADEGDEEE